jgi:LysM domain
MTALWLEPDPRPIGSLDPVGSPDLRLLGSGLAPRPDEFQRPSRGGSRGLRLVETPEPSVRTAPRRRTSVAVRRRRTLLVAMGILVVALALPLSGTGGHSHATGSALAETGGATTYTVKTGDTLWTIAEQVNPTADPRPLVAKLAAQTGSDSVVPGERIVLP